VGAVSPAWVEARLSLATVRVLDVRAEVPRDPDESGPRLRVMRSGPASAYVRGHLPGAVALDVRAQLFDAAGEVVSAPELALAMSRLGVGDGHTVVLVDDGRREAALAAAWALARYGHRAVHILEGGFSRWVAEGRAVSRELPRIAPASFTARVPS